MKNVEKIKTHKIDEKNKFFFCCFLAVLGLCFVSPSPTNRSIDFYEANSKKNVAMRMNYEARRFGGMVFRAAGAF